MRPLGYSVQRTRGLHYARAAASLTPAHPVPTASLDHARWKANRAASTSCR